MKLQRGATKVGRGLDDIWKVPVPITPVAEQAKIVSEIERRFSIVEKLESALAADLTGASAMPRSILQHVFLLGEAA
jgi:type I restriction enzyme S subunit